MALPITYDVHNVFVRWRARRATMLGIALVAVADVVQNLCKKSRCELFHQEIEA